MSESAPGLAHSEPTVMWRMRRADVLAHAVISVNGSGPVLAWYINGRPLGERTFADWTDAIQWSDQLQAQNWAVGWRLVSD